MLAPAVFAFGLVAFGFLGMGPVTIAVDSYGPVTDNAQSVYELSLIEQVPNVQAEIKRDFNIDVELRPRQGHAGSQRRRRQHLQGHGQAGADRHRRGRRHHHDLLDHHGAYRRPDRQRGQAVAAARAVRAWPDHAAAPSFTGSRALPRRPSPPAPIARSSSSKRNIHLEGAEKASVADSKKVVDICTQVRAERHVEHLHRLCSSARWRSPSSSRSSSSAT